jgi:hypothetical protein
MGRVLVAPSARESPVSCGGLRWLAQHGAGSKVTLLDFRSRPVNRYLNNLKWAGMRLRCLSGYFQCCLFKSFGVLCREKFQ